MKVDGHLNSTHGRRCVNEFVTWHLKPFQNLDAVICEALCISDECIVLIMTGFVMMSYLHYDY